MQSIILFKRAKSIFLKVLPKAIFSAIDASIKNIEDKFNKKVVTYVKQFNEFYMAETYHQDYYVKNFIRYLMYKKGCQREETLNKIWG